MAIVDPSGPYEPGQRVLQNYTIRELIGKGGHAFVYEAYHEALQRVVAIKVITNPPGRDLGRALKEARTLDDISHPNVIFIRDAIVTPEGFVAIIMERLHGRTLGNVLSELQTLRVNEALSIGAAVAEGVQAAHRRNIVHRDLKPENIFVLENNGVKVLDFGIAKYLGPGAKTTERDLLQGTLPYMSPEHLMGMRVTPRSDIFALGVVLYESLCGRAPCFIGIEEPTIDAITYAQLYREPRSLTLLSSSIPRHVDRIVRRMLVKEPADRFETMAEVAEALRMAARRVAMEAGSRANPPRELWKKSTAASVHSRRRDPHLQTTKLRPRNPFGETVAVETFADTDRVSKPPYSGPQEGATAPVEHARTRPPRRTANTGLGMSAAIARPVIAPGMAGSIRKLTGGAVATGTILGLVLGFTQRPAPALKSETPTTARSAAPASSPAPTVAGAAAPVALPDPPAVAPATMPSPPVKPLPVASPPAPARPTATPRAEARVKPPPQPSKAPSAETTASSIDWYRPFFDAPPEPARQLRRSFRPVDAPLPAPAPSAPKSKPLYGREDIE